MKGDSSATLWAVLQGFDKYGVWACEAVPVPNLQKALSLKVRLVDGTGFMSGLLPRYLADWTGRSLCCMAAH